MEIDKYINISMKHSKTFVDSEGLKIRWCGKELKVLSVIPGAWVVKNYRIK